MCGVVGIHRFDGAPVDEADIGRMSALLRHRGPDDDGCWVDGSTGLGHRRLSIIDVDSSNQPMASADGNLRISFNGEILNYRQLRAGLRYPFRTAGDTETLLAVLAQRGIDGLRDVRGQFAFACYDRRAGTLMLARDRLGILPLYYYADRSFIAFASEIKALLPVLPGGPRVDRASLYWYLRGRSVPAPATLFEGVRKVPQGHTLTVGPDGVVVVRPYWRIPHGGEVLDVGPAAATDLVEQALQRSVEESLEADVPVGAYLSGGVDSSLIVALASEARDGGGIETFSAGFDDPRVDEVGYARAVSRYLGTTHHEVTVTASDLRDLWHELTWHRDAPLSEPADVAVFRLAQLARQHVKVVLSGEGSDELFAGYPKYRFARLTGDIGWVPPEVRRSLVRGGARLLPPGAHRLRIALRALGEAAEEERIAAWFAPFTRSERETLVGAPGRDLGSETLWPEPTGDVLQRMLYADSHAWLADNLLERGDRMSMAASLELRPPFLDHRIVELAFSLPSSLKINRGTTKWLVKEVARRRLPPEIVDRPKSGFRVPLDAWFRADLSDMTHDLLLGPDSFVADVLDRRLVAELVDGHARGRRNEDIRIWTLLGLEVWHDTFFRSPLPTGRHRSSKVLVSDNGRLGTPDPATR